MSRIYSIFLGSRGGTQPQQLHEKHNQKVSAINEQLHQLCMPATGPHWRDRRISQNGVRKIQTCLGVLDGQHNRYDDFRWARRPRLYAILHNIGAIEYMDDFIEEQLTDFNLPFNEQTLPPFVGQKNGMNLRRAFFAIQEHFLTEIKGIESEKSDHLRLSVSGDMFFFSQKPLGSGSFGSVDLVISHLSTESYARKRTLRSRGSEQAQKFLIDELRTLRRLSHQHLVRIVGSYTDPQYIAYLMKPVAAKTLNHFLDSSRPLRADEKDILRPFYGCLSGAMNYLYAHRIRHRDLTTRNILIDHQNKVYISDFGSSYNWKSKPSSKTKHQNVPTSPDYMAPEVAKEEERGTRSDMWSLGIIFLEMATKLLGHRLATFRSKIKQNADKEKVRPYAYANIPAVINWMKTLGITNTEYEHDKEPLGWIRELLHFEYEHRLTPPQLVRYVSESPSLHSFCCIECRGNFYDESFTYGIVGSRTDAKEDSRRTQQEVESVFLGDEPGSQSNEAANSIEKWIQSTHSFETPDTELSTTLYPEGSPGFEDNQDYISIGADQFLYTSFEHELYKQTNFSSLPEAGSENDGLLPSLDSGKPYESTGNRNWPKESQSSSHIDPKLGRRTKQLQDSRLGFLEYISNSTDDNDGPELPFEEWTDHSSSQSDEGSLILTPTTPISALFNEAEALIEQEKDALESKECFGLRYSEGGVSDTDSRRNKVSDRLRPSDKSTVDKPGDTTGREFNLPHENTAPLIRSPLRPAKSPPSTSGTVKRSLTPDNTAREIEKDDSTTNLPEDGQVPSSILEQQMEKPGIVQELSPTVMSSRSPLGSRPTVPSLSKAEKETRAGTQKTTSSRPQTQNQFQNSVKAEEDFEREKENNHDRVRNSGAPTIVPTIVIDGAAGDPQPDRPQLSKDNLRFINKTVQPIIPRSRDALMPVDPGQLIDSTWEMASSSPTSIISESTKSKITGFFLMIPTEKEIEHLLSFHCQKGSAGTVKAILQRDTPGTKPPKKLRYFYPLIYAVRGGTSRHNKCVRELLAAGANPNMKTKRSGQTPLHIAVQHSNFKGYLNLIWLLLSNDADPNIADRSDEYPLTKLFASAEPGPLEPHKRNALVMLLKKGASANFTISGTGNTPLHLAVRRRDKIAVAMLLHNGADVDAKTTGGSTPLTMTANQFGSELSADHAEVLEHLLQYGANVNMRAGAQGRTVLHWAVLAGCAQAVTRLLEAGADARLQDWDGFDAMSLAIKSAPKRTSSADAGQLADHVEIMLGLEKAARHDLKLEEGKCAIRTACTNKDGAMLRTLLSIGLNLDSKLGQKTILDFATEQGSAAARRVLLKEQRRLKGLSK